MNLKPAFCVCIALAALVAPVFGEDAQVGDTRDEASGMPQKIIGRETPEDNRVTLQAREIEIVGDTYRASGDVHLQVGKERLSAASAEYNTATGAGRLQHATFTTCSNTRPDYHLTAREISLLPNHKLRAKGIALYVGNFKVLALPMIKIRAGRRSATRHVFPTPGFDQTDGVTLSQEFRVIDEDNLRANADLRFTEKKGIQGQIYSLIGLDGNISDLPGRYLTFDSLRSGVLELPPETDENCASIAGPDPRAARLVGFGTFALRQRTYNINNTGLMVDRRPELGLSYRANQIYLTKSRLDPRLEIYPQATTSWGLFRESPGLESSTSRTTAGVLAAANILPLGPNTTLQPIFAYDWSGYGVPSDYRVASTGFDAGHLWRNGSIGSIRYIQRHESGQTPFQFDRVQINRELQTAMQVGFGGYVAGLVIGYNFDTGSVYDWEAMYGWRSDCLGTSIRYDQRLRKLTLNIHLINL